LKRQARAAERARRDEQRRIARLAAERQRERDRATAAMERARAGEQRKAAKALDRAAMDRARMLATNATKRRNKAAAEAFIDSGKLVTKATPVHIKIAQRAVIEERAEAARLADPVEQAKLALQRRGRVVYSMAIYGGEPDRFFCSGLGKDVSAERLLAEAERLAA
jgi:multidrug efflux pump subunit AcrA (membrane-fusion protein)